MSGQVPTCMESKTILPNWQCHLAQDLKYLEQALLSAWGHREACATWGSGYVCPSKQPPRRVLESHLVVPDVAGCACPPTERPAQWEMGIGLGSVWLITAWEPQQKAGRAGCQLQLGARRGGYGAPWVGGGVWLDWGIGKGDMVAERRHVARPFT